MIGLLVADTIARMRCCGCGELMKPFERVESNRDPSGLFIHPECRKPKKEETT